MNISQKSFTVFNWQTIQKCQLFIETPGRMIILVSTGHANDGIIWPVCTQMN